MKLYIYMVLICIITACSTNQKKSSEFTISFTNSVDIIEGIEIKKLEDYILIRKDLIDNKDFAFDVYSRDSLKLITKIIECGDKPDQFIQPAHVYPVIGTNSFYILDFSRGLYYFNVDSLLKFPLNYVAKKVKDMEATEWYLGVYSSKESAIVNIGNSDTIFRIMNNGKVRQFALKDEIIDNFSQMPQNAKFAYNNFLIDISPDGKKYSLVSECFDAFALYDSNFKLIKKLKTDYVPIDLQNPNTLIDPLFFCEIHSTEKYIVSSYLGKPRVRNSEYGYQSNYPSVLKVFNWEGNYIDSINTPVTIVAFELDSKYKKFYYVSEDLMIKYCQFEE